MGSGSSSIVPISASQSPDNINQFISSFSKDFSGQVRLLGNDLTDVDASNIILLKKNRKLTCSFWNGEDVFIGSISMWETKIQIFTFCVHMFRGYKFLIINLPMQIHQNVIEYIENQENPITRAEILEKILFFYSNQNIFKNLKNNNTDSNNQKARAAPRNTKSKGRKNSVSKRTKKPKKIQIPRMIINAPLSITESEKTNTSSHSSSGKKVETISIGLKSPQRRRSKTNLLSTNTNPSSSGSTKNNAQQSSNYQKNQSASNIPRKNSVLESDFHTLTDDKINTPSIYKMSHKGETDQQEAYYEEEEANDYDEGDDEDNTEKNLVLSYEEEVPNNQNDSRKSNNSRNRKNPSIKQRDIQNIQYQPPPPPSKKKIDKDFAIKSTDLNDNNNNAFNYSTSATFSDRVRSNRYSYSTTNTNNQQQRDISSTYYTYASTATPTTATETATNNESHHYSPNRKTRNHIQKAKQREVPSKTRDSKSPQSAHNRNRSSSINNNRRRKNDFFEYDEDNNNNNDYNKPGRSTNNNNRKSRNRSLSNNNNKIDNDDPHHHHHHRRSSSTNNASNHYYNNANNNANGSSRNRSTSSSGRRKIRVRKYPIQKVQTSSQNRSHSQPRASLRRIKYAKDANEFASNIAFFSSEEEDNKIKQKRAIQNMQDYYNKIGSSFKAEIARENEESSGSLSFFDLTNREIKKYKNSDDEIDVQHVFQDYSSIDFSNKNYTKAKLNTTTTNTNNTTNNSTKNTTTSNTNNSTRDEAKANKPNDAGENESKSELLDSFIKNNEELSNESKGFSGSSYIKEMLRTEAHATSINDPSFDTKEQNNPKKKSSNSKVTNRRANKKSGSKNRNSDSNSSSFFYASNSDAKRTEEEKNKIWESINFDSKEKTSKFTKPRKETDIIDDEESSSASLNNRPNSKSKRVKNRAESVRSSSSCKREKQQRQQKASNDNQVQSLNSNKNDENVNEIQPRNVKLRPNKKSKVRAESVHSHHSIKPNENKPTNYIETTKKIKSKNSNSNSNSESSAASKDNNKRRKKPTSISNSISNLNSDNLLNSETKDRNSSSSSASKKRKNSTPSKKFHDKHCEYLISPTLNDAANLINSKKNRMLVDVKYHEEISFLDE